MTDHSAADSRPTNRLIDETSPYLLQHACNPVDWFPWGEEALQLAREKDCPIFLSIGYSACHWCHVMEHESFENPAIAEMMNRDFVNIKVDREERPDLDQIYMNAVVAISGRGGWPMSVFLTPEMRPFFGGTYWPPEPRMGMPGFPQILERVSEIWTTRRDDINNNATQLTAAVTQMSHPQGEPIELKPELITQSVGEMLASADCVHGGFGGAPKFPHAMDLRLLLRAGQRDDDSENDPISVAQLTLSKMARGGIYDHLGGGFHRYSTDARWLVPHFEKMLYDNALLASTYLEAYQLTLRNDFATTARETLDYVLREMTQPEGGFYSTQDADSEGEEGKFFVWNETEIDSVLTDGDEARAFKLCYDVTPAGNWEGMTILNRKQPHATTAQELGLADDELTNLLSRCRKTLYKHREQRIHPGRDDKVLMSWNGMMIAALAQGARVLNQEKYRVAAVAACDFILENMRNDDGRLLHSFKDGQARFNACLDDYACLIDGLIEVYQATFEARFVTAALELAVIMVEQFHDVEQGGFYYTGSDHETLITRQKDNQDNATPSGNSMAATALLKLGQMTGRTDLEQNAYETLEMLSGQMARIPTAMGQALLAVDYLLAPAKQIVVVGGDDSETTDAFLQEINGRFLPNAIVLFRPQSQPEDEIPTVFQPLLTDKAAIDDQTTVYICQAGACSAPISSLPDLQESFD